MSNARDKANIPALNFSSTGIDDNATSTAITIDSSQRVGIGTASPARIFSVNASTDNTAASFTSTDANCNITFVDDSTTADGYVSFGCTGDDAVIRSGNSESIRIDSSGNVGIGNTTMSNFNASARQLVVGSGSGDNGITIFAGTTNNSSLFLADGTTGTNGYRGSINYLHNGDALTLHANATETMRLTNGKVGIGTSNPATRLHLQLGSSGATANFYSTAVLETNNPYNVLQFISPNIDNQQIRFGDPQSNGAGIIQYAHNGDHMSFITADTERMRIDSSGNVLVNATSGIFGSKLEVAGSSATVMQGFNHTATTSGTHVVQMETGRLGGGIGTGNFIRLTDGGNLRFQFKGDGNATCDGSFSGGGADYAEYFEWVDGNSSNEDRVGLSVVLDNGKIREATASDTNIIGVVSANPTVVGDEQPNHWQDKFIRDDFGRVQYETLTTWKWEIEDENGKTTDGYIEGRTDKEIPANAINVESFEHSYERINSNYDETLQYTPRSQRQEWSCVGLMGKLRIKKGQQTNSNWIKIRDISDTVEEWLIK